MRRDFIAGARREEEGNTCQPAEPLLRLTGTHEKDAPPIIPTNVLSHSALPQSWMYTPSIPLCALGHHVHVDCALAKAAQDLGVHGARK